MRYRLLHEPSLAQRAPQWVNVVLVLSSPHTGSGKIECAYDDLAVRKRSL